MRNPREPLIHLLILPYRRLLLGDDMDEEDDVSTGPFIPSSDVELSDAHPHLDFGDLSE